MGVYNASGTRLTKAGLPITPYVEPDPKFTLTQTLTRRRVYPGQEDNDHSEGQEVQVLADAGQVVRQSQIDSWFPPATIASISPTTGITAGGTVVTIKGTNLDGVTSVTFGGTAGTALTITDSTSLTVTTPAKSAGAVAVVVVDDAGSVTQASAFTYA